METNIQEALKQLKENLKLPEPEVINFSDHKAIDKMLREEFPDVKRTAKEIYLGKLHSYQLAARRTLDEQKERRKKERIEYFTKMWSYEQMQERAIETGKMIGISENFQFVIDDNNRHAFHLLCLYFTNDKKFETYGIGDKKYSLNKGIWLQSPTRGTGKTVLLRCFYMNKRCCFGYKHTRELATMFQKGGFEAIDPYISTLPQLSTPENFYQSDAGMMYDELFTGEDKVNHMGSPLFISDYIINSLYDFSTSKNKNQKWKFHCTSNSSGEDIEKIGGKNYRSRMIDMFNLIKLDGPDRR
jgi:hypothetical protein